MRSASTLIPFALLLAGCGTFVTATPLNPSPHPVRPRGFEAVPVYSSAPPSKPYVDVALLEVEQSHQSEGGTVLMVQRLRERAGTMGCDAVVIGGMREQSVGLKSTILHATCIVYK